MNKHRAKTLMIAVALLARPVFSYAQSKPALSREAIQAVNQIIVQHAGRHKPFASFSREVLDAITGHPQWAGEEPSQTVISIIADPDSWNQEEMVAIPFVPLREPVGMNPKSKRISYSDLVASRKLMRLLPAIVQKQQQDEKLSMLENETMDAFQRFVTLSNLLDQKIEAVPPVSGQGSWLSISEPEGYPGEKQMQFRQSWSALLSAVKRNDSPVVAAAAREFSAAMRQANPSAYPEAWRINLELFYYQAAPFVLARLLYLFAAIGIGMSLAWPKEKKGMRKRIGFALLAAAFLVHTAGIALRVIIGGRPPVSNFFETMLWLPYVAVLAALVFERIYKAKYFAIAASILAFIVLLLADYVPLDSSITPVVAVLRSNLWLTIHVLTIVASYGAIALAAVLAHIYGWMFLLGRHRGRPLKNLDLFLYRSIQVGVVLLAGGIMLGAVWANASWGRYWGWDPKETWALITLLWYIAILHGRFAGWLRGVGVALATIAGFFLLLMTYYGVSFYLVGLHSYAGGNAKPLPALLVGYAIIEALFIVILGAAARRRAA